LDLRNQPFLDFFPKKLGFVWQISGGRQNYERCETLLKRDGAERLAVCDSLPPIRPLLIYSRFRHGAITSCDYKTKPIFFHRNKCLLLPL
jgi:hypothetical protein